MGRMVARRTSGAIVPIWTAIPDAIFTQGVAADFDLSPYVTAPALEALVALAQSGVALSTPPFTVLLSPHPLLRYDGSGALMAPTVARYVASSVAQAVTNMQIRRGGSILTPQYTTLAAAINAVQNNDIIEVEPKVYSSPGNAVDIAVANLTIRSSVPGSFASIAAPSGYTKGLLHRTTTAAGSLITEDIDFSGFIEDGENHGGYWPEGGPWQFISRRCKWHSFNNGAITGPHVGANALYENCEIYDCGDGNGSTHGMYYGGIDNLTVRGSYFHDVDDGHLCKTRAKSGLIEYNRFSSETAPDSREFEAPCGGDYVLRGNRFVQDANSANGDIVAWGNEGSTTVGVNCPADGRTQSMVFVRNTVIDRRGSANFLVFGGSGFPGLPTATIVDNVFSGSAAPSIAGNIVRTFAQFVNEAADDFRLLVPVTGSALWGVNQMYVHPRILVARADQLMGACA